MPKIESFFDELSERLNALGGVETVGAVSSLPLSGIGPRGRYRGRIDDSESGRVMADLFVVTPDYFRSLRIPVLRGRTFENADRLLAQPGLVIDEKMAERLWPGQDPIGQTMQRESRAEDAPWEPVIGVVREVRKYPLGRIFSGRSAPEGQVYKVLSAKAERPTRAVYLTVRAQGDPLNLLEPIRKTIWDLDENLPASRADTLESAVAAFSSRARLNMFLLAVMAAIAWVLGAIGIYGVTAFAVTQRWREFAIRTAIGGGRRHLMRIVVGGGFKDILLGLAIGLTLFFGLNQILSSLLVGVSSLDPTTYVVAVLILLVTGLLSCYFPARRATRMDPVAVLRHQ